MREVGQFHPFLEARGGQRGFCAPFLVRVSHLLRLRPPLPPRLARCCRASRPRWIVRIPSGCQGLLSLLGRRLGLGRLVCDPRAPHDVVPGGAWAGLAAQVRRLELGDTRRRVSPAPSTLRKQSDVVHRTTTLLGRSPLGLGRLPGKTKGSGACIEREGVGGEDHHGISIPSPSSSCSSSPELELGEL